MPDCRHSSATSSCHSAAFCRLKLAVTTETCPYCSAPYAAGQDVCPVCGMAVTLPDSTLPAGTQLHDGKFAVGRVLGEGGFGITYKGVHKDLRRVVAIKEFFPVALGTRRMGSRVTVSASRKAAFDREQESVLEEARAIAGLHCNSIVDVYDAFRENGTVYIVLEYLEGQTLAERIQQAGRLAEHDVVSIGHSLCNALEEIHVRQLLHRDVKPANVLLTRDGRTVLIDFGSARTYSADQTVRHTRILTAEYAAPEQYSDRGRFGPYTDIFCLGATLYHALVGVPPPGALTRLQGSHPAVDFPQVPNGALCQAMQRALALRIEDRPATVADFRHLLTGDARDSKRANLPAVPNTQPQPPKAEPTDTSGKEVNGLRIRGITPKAKPASRPADTPLPAGSGTVVPAGPATYRYCSKSQRNWMIGLAALWLFWVLVGAGSYNPAPFMVLSFLCVMGLFWIMPAVIAHKKGRRGWLWLVYGVVLGLAALLHSILIPHLESPRGRQR